MGQGRGKSMVQGEHDGWDDGESEGGLERLSYSRSTASTRLVSSVTPHSRHTIEDRHADNPVHGKGGTCSSAVQYT